MIRAVLLDLLGVVYDGDTPIPGAAAAIERLRKAGLPLRFVSNTTRSPRSKIIAQLVAMGIEVGMDEQMRLAVVIAQPFDRGARRRQQLFVRDLDAHG
ncbi:MAG: hypothetical protein E5W02_25245, partial [Mesorhizobium sp.]